MKKRYTHTVITSILIFLGLLAAFVLIEGLLVKFNGKPVAVPDIPREAITYGEGEPLNYVVLGDSLSVGQGGDYQTGMAVTSAQQLAKTNKVSMTNVGVSGARAKDVLDKQLSGALKAKPDVALIIIGSNDITHITGIESVKSSINSTISQLVESNCHIKIVLTGSADMGAVPRLPQPLRYFAGQRVKKLNHAVTSIVQDNQLTFAPIAEKTGQAFRDDPTLFAADKFHPNTRGYDVMNTVIVSAVNEALDSQPSHCN